MATPKRKRKVSQEKKGGERNNYQTVEKVILNLEREKKNSRRISGAGK